MCFFLSNVEEPPVDREVLLLVLESPVDREALPLVLKSLMGTISL